MSKQRMVGRRELFSLFATDLMYLGGALVPTAAWELADMGTARLDRERCLAYQSQVCNACYHACPLELKAIELRSGRYPEINGERCKGCGECAEACLAPMPAILVPASPLKVIDTRMQWPIRED